MADTLQWFSAVGTSLDAGGVAVSGGGTQLGCDGELLDGVTGRFAPPVAYSEMVVPGQPGAVLTAVRHDVREVDVPFVLDTQNCATPERSLRTAVRLLARLLDPVRGDGYLLSTAPDGSQRKLVCRCMQGPQMTEQFAQTQMEDVMAFMLVFRTTDTFPYWRDVVAVTQTWTTPAAETFFPFFPLELAESTINQDPVTITVAGDVAVWPVWTVTGPFEGVRLTLGTRTFELVYSAGAGDVVTIDTGAKTVTLDDGTSLFSSVTEPFLFQLEPGDNDVTIVVTDGDTGTRIALSYYDGWLSV